MPPAAGHAKLVNVHCDHIEAAGADLDAVALHLADDALCLGGVGRPGVGFAHHVSGT